MIRQTQSYLIRRIVEHLSNSNYSIIYTDYPQASRGGVGRKSVVHYVFETLYDRAPDIVAYKDKLLLLVEVNSKLENRYIEKFIEYKRKEVALLRELGERLNLPIVGVSFGFGMKKRVVTVDIENLQFDLTIYVFNNSNDIIEEAVKRKATNG